MSFNKLYGGLALFLLSLVVLFFFGPRIQWRPFAGVSGRLTKINATFVDAQGHPIQGASFYVTDAANQPLEDPLELVYLSNDAGRVSYSVPASDTYLIRGSAGGYFPSAMTQVTSLADKIFVTLVLTPKPFPYPMTTLRVKVVDAEGRPVPTADVDVSNQAGEELQNWYGDFLFTNRQGRTDSTVRTGGVFMVRVQADGYPMKFQKVVSKPGVVPVTVVLKQEGTGAGASPAPTH